MEKERVARRALPGRRVPAQEDADAGHDAGVSFVRREPDATAQVNIVLRVGGALGGAVFAVILAGRLPDGPETAFHTAFAWLSAASLLGVAAAVWLLRAELETARSARAREGRSAAGGDGRPADRPA
jgi:hypothetical protein